MDKEPEILDSEAAQATLDSVTKMTFSGLRRGLYPRWFAAVTSIWAGAIATLIGLGSPVWLLLAPAGLFGYYLYRRKQGAWVQEVRSPREFWLVIVPIALVGSAAGLAGLIGYQQFDLFWAPVVAGTAIAAGLFSLMEFAYGRAWASIRSENDA